MVFLQPAACGVRIQGPVLPIRNHMRQRIDLHESRVSIRNGVLEEPAGPTPTFASFRPVSGQPRQSDLETNGFRLEHSAIPCRVTAKDRHMSAQGPSSAGRPLAPQSSVWGECRWAALDPNGGLSLPSHAQECVAGQGWPCLTGCKPIGRSPDRWGSRKIWPPQGPYHKQFLGWDCRPRCRFRVLLWLSFEAEGKVCLPAQG